MFSRRSGGRADDEDMNLEGDRLDHGRAIDLYDSFDLVPRFADLYMALALSLVRQRWLNFGSMLDARPR